MKLLQNRTALITGCNRGIGKSIVEKFALEGANIICAIRKENPIFKEFTDFLAGKNGVSIKHVYFDLTDVESIKNTMRALTKEIQEIDILVNNAGIAEFKPFMLCSLDDFKNLMHINFYAHVIVSQFVAKNMIRRKKGSIINMCSISGIDSNLGNSAYGASKSAMISLTRTMAKELAKAHIRVNAVAPGFVETDMNKQIDSNYMDSMIHQISIGRIAFPSEIASTVAFLASDEASYITGQVIRIDGGL